MEAKVAIIFFFLFFAFSLQAMSSPITEKSDDIGEKKQTVLKELEKVVGRPNFAASDHGEWEVRAVQFILEKMNWKYNFSGGDQKPDPKEIEVATRRIVTAIGWILSDPQLNPYRSFTDWLASFTYLFNYLRDLEKGKLSGGLKNPVYKCYKRFWPTCEARAPATLEGAVVYRFECGWEFYEKCLKYHIIDGRPYQPDLQERAVRPSKPGGSYNRGCNKIFLCRPGK